MSHTTTSLRARALALDAHTIAAHIDAAETNLDTAQAGWPTSCAGAAPPTDGPGQDGTCTETATYANGHPHPCNHPLPCPNHPTNSQHIVERVAGHDTARHDLETLREHIRKATHHARQAARIATAHGAPRLDKSTVGERLAAIDADLWCPNCSRHGARNVKEPGRPECAFCADIRRNFGVAAPAELIDMNGRRRLYESDIIRILERAGLKWKRPKKAAQKKAS